VADPVPVDEFTTPGVSDLLRGDALDVVRDIAPNDPMYEFAPDLYFRAGSDALRCIRLAILAAELQTVHRVLDFACGKGRVLRTLKAAFPQADLVASDTWREALEFCSRVFGVTTIRASLRPEEVELDGSFDVIWCGSLLTHVGHDRWLGFVKLFESLLARGGVVVFTTYGRFMAENVRTGEELLTFSEEQAQEVLRDYERTGFGFCPSFRPEQGQGDCLASPSWVCQQLDATPSLEFLLYMERGWLGQDVIACTRRGWAPPAEIRSGSNKA
jgi:SAM-dependent methyltransferase